MTPGDPSNLDPKGFRTLLVDGFLEMVCKDG